MNVLTHTLHSKSPLILALSRQCVAQPAPVTFHSIPSSCGATVCMLNMIPTEMGWGILRPHWTLKICYKNKSVYRVSFTIVLWLHPGVNVFRFPPQLPFPPYSSAAKARFRVP